MEIVNRKDIQPILDACGKLEELYNSDNLSLSYVVIDSNARSHMHKKTEEVYFIIKGKANMKIGDEKRPIKEGDVISIPKNQFHSIEDVEETMELVVVTHPKYDPDDLIYEDA